ncbi:MAG: hypothetical protein ACLP1X_08085 [Polyangiaceae bacterium]|jgi:hypothetical protein
MEPVFNVGHVLFAVGKSGGILPLPPAVDPLLEAEPPLDPDEAMPLDPPLDADPIPELLELPPDPEPVPLLPEAAPEPDPEPAPDPEPLPELAPLLPEPTGPLKGLVAADPHDAMDPSAARRAAVSATRTLLLERMGVTTAPLPLRTTAENVGRAILIPPQLGFARCSRIAQRKAKRAPVGLLFFNIAPCSFTSSADGQRVLSLVRSVGRVVVEVRRKPPLDLPHGHALAQVIIDHLIAVDLS